LRWQNKLAEAEAACRKAIALAPDVVSAHYSLGLALLEQRKYGPAEAAFRKALDLKPNHGLACHSLGLALKHQARFEEAITWLNKARDLLPVEHPCRAEARQMQRQCRRYAALDARLPAILKGTDKPIGAAEQIEFAQLCLLKQRYASAAGFFADAFAMKPELAEDRTGYRYDAACAAALVGCGRSEDGASWGDAERTRWRARARQWLRAELGAWAKQLAKGPGAIHREAYQTLAWWLKDPDLTSLRDPDALEKLPAAERRQFRALWSEHHALLQRARP
jgi:tetratricopeptide (TPR) repeat protein